MMVKVLLYADASGVFSSRKIARKLHEDVAFRVRGASNFPKHRIICDFRALHLLELAALFVQVVKLVRECGLVKLGAIAVDGTRVKASALRHKAMSYQRMLESEAQLKQQSAALLDQARATDAAEKNELELDIPAEIARGEERFRLMRQRPYGGGCACADHRRGRIDHQWRRQRPSLQAVQDTLKATPGLALADAGFRA